MLSTIFILHENLDFQFKQTLHVFCILVNIFSSVWLDFPLFFICSLCLIGYTHKLRRTAVCLEQVACSPSETCSVGCCWMHYVPLQGVSLYRGNSSQEVAYGLVTCAVHSSYTPSTGVHSVTLLVSIIWLLPYRTRGRGIERMFVQATIG